MHIVLNIMAYLGLTIFFFNFSILIKHLWSSLKIPINCPTLKLQNSCKNFAELILPLNEDYRCLIRRIEKLNQKVDLSRSASFKGWPADLNKIKAAPTCREGAEFVRWRPGAVWTLEASECVSRGARYHNTWWDSGQPVRRRAAGACLQHQPIADTPSSQYSDVTHPPSQWCWSTSVKTAVLDRQLAGVTSVAHVRRRQI